MKRRGFTVLELLVALTLFSIVGLLAFLGLSRAGWLWRRVMGSEQAELEMRKAASRLQRDVELAEYASLTVRDGPNSLGTPDGAAFCMLSAMHEPTGTVARKDNGTPFWQRNVLYYLAVPRNHDTLFGIRCGGGSGPNGFNDRCPHKVLIRKVIDSGQRTDPSLDERTQENILRNLSPFLTRPQGYDVGFMNGESGVQSVEIVASHLLTFEVKVAPDANFPREVEIDLAAVDLQDAQKTLQLGMVPLSTGSFTRHLTLSLVPGN